jgi:hypothetical protein
MLKAKKTDAVADNGSNFHGSEQLGVAALLPREFLNLIRKRP